MRVLSTTLPLFDCPLLDCGQKRAVNFCKLEGTFHLFFIGHQNLGKNFSRQERTDFVGGKPLKDGDAKATRLKTF